jgi:hypothetical protein
MSIFSIYGMSIFVIYGLCFVFLYIVPATLFLRRLKIPGELRKLENLTVEPHYDKNKNVAFIKNNFDVFSFGLGRPLRGNYPLKILRRICINAENGKRYNPALYLSLYKKEHIRLLGNLFLASHIAPLIILFWPGFAPGDLFDILLSLQFMWYVLLVVLQRLLARNLDAFTEVFYRNWHDKLLNFDIISVNALKDRLFNETHSVSDTEINNITSKLKDAFSAPAAALLSASSVLAAALAEFSAGNRKGELVTAESVIASLDANLKRIELLCENLENAAALSKESYKDMHKFVHTNEITINAVNALADEFSGLRRTLAGHLDASGNTAIEKLAGIATALENNVNKTFMAIEETLKTNTQELSKTYEYFFDICRTITERQAEEDA